MLGYFFFFLLVSLILYVWGYFYVDSIILYFVRCGITGWVFILSCSFCVFVWGLKKVKEVDST